MSQEFEITPNFDKHRQLLEITIRQAHAFVTLLIAEADPHSKYDQYKVSIELPHDISMLKESGAYIELVKMIPEVIDRESKKWFADLDISKVVIWLLTSEEGDSFDDDDDDDATQPTKLDNAEILRIKREDRNLVRSQNKVVASLVAHGLLKVYIEGLAYTLDSTQSQAGV